MNHSFHSAFRPDKHFSWSDGRSWSDALTDAEIAAHRAKRTGNGKVEIPRRAPCDCRECIINGKRLALHRPEDWIYSRARAALVDEAVRITEIIVGRNGNPDAYTATLNAAMDELVRQRGLLNGSNGHAGHVNSEPNTGSACAAGL